MKGRLEHELKTKGSIEKLLKDMPEYVSKFYYNIQLETAPSTCFQYIYKIRAFLRYFDGKEAYDIDSDMIALYLNHLSYVTEEDGEVRRTSAAHIKATWSALNKFYDYLKKRKLIQENPMEIVPRPKRKDDRKQSIIKQEDLKSIIEVVETGDLYYDGAHSYDRWQKWSARDYAILMILNCTGMRVSALTELNVDDISYENMTITSVDKRDKTHEYNITPAMKEILDAWLKKRKEMLAGKECEALFLSYRKQRISVVGVSRLVRKCTEIAIGVPQSPHKLRGAFGEGVYERNGHDIEATRIAMGHESIATTSIYIKNKNDAKEKAIEATSDFLYNN